MRKSTQPKYVAFLLGSLALASSALADEYFIDGTGQGDFTTIQAGVDTATDGDTVFLRRGTYSEDVVIRSVSVNLVGLAPGAALLVGTMQVLDLGPRQDVLIADLQFQTEPDHPGPNPGERALSIKNCAGHVRVSGCQLSTASREFYSSPSAPTVAVEDSAAVTFAGCRVTANMDYSPVIFSSNGMEGQDALAVHQSRLALFDCVLLGGHGLLRYELGRSGDGGEGLSVTASDVRLVGCSVAAGHGGNGYLNSGVLPGDGGDAMQVDTSSSAVLIDSTFTLGYGGYNGTSIPGADGVPISGSGVTRTLPVAAERHSTATLVRSSSMHPIRVEGPAGAVARLSFYLKSPSTFDLTPARPGPGLPGGAVGVTRPLITVPLGTIPPGGVLEANAAIPAIPASVGAIPVTLRIHTGTRSIDQVRGTPLEVLVVNCDSALPDCDASGRSDLCELTEGTAADIDGDGHIDSCQADCNGNGVSDAVDIDAGLSFDRNLNGLPDECEFMGASIYVDPAGPVGGDGSLALPFGSILEAVEAAADGDAVTLLPGTHQGIGTHATIVLNKSLAIRSEPGAGPVTVVVGPADTLDFRNSPAALIQGIRFSGESGFNAVLSLEDSTAIVRDCVFEGSANPTHHTRAISCRDSDLRLFRTEFRDTGPGSSAGLRGGMQVVGSRLVARECLFIGNGGAFSRGGAIHLQPSANKEARFVRCEFRENSCRISGGAIYISGFQTSASLPTVFASCLFAANSADRGGGINSDHGPVRIDGCTFVDNQATDRGSALDCLAELDITNSILRGATAPGGGLVHVTGSGPHSVRSCNVEGGVSSLNSSSGAYSTVAITSAPPAFVSRGGADGDPFTTTDNDYRMLPGSPTIDAGNTDLILGDATDEDQDGVLTAEPLSLDLAGGPRQKDDLSAPNTGQGPDIPVDLGCHER